MNKKILLVLTLLMIVCASVVFAQDVLTDDQNVISDVTDDDALAAESTDEALADGEPLIADDTPSPEDAQTTDNANPADGAAANDGGDTSLKVKVMWDDKGNEKKRPSSVDFTLAGKTYTVKKSDDWEKSIKGDFKESDKLSAYEIDGYTAKVDGNAKDGFNITYTYDDIKDDAAAAKEPVAKEPAKKVKSAAKEPAKKVKVKDKHNTGTPVFLGILAVSCIGLAVGIRKKE